MSHLHKAIMITTVFIAISSQSRAQEIAFVPIGADGAHTIAGDEIILQGGGQLVELAIMISGWDPNLDGAPLLGTYQAAFDSSSFSSGTGDPLTAFATPDATAGAYVILKRCTVGQLVDPNGPRCDIVSCPAGEFCVDNSGLVVAGFDPLCGVATILPDYEYFCTTGPGAITGVPDDGTARYGGTLLIEVPATAAGTYTIAFKNNPQISFMLDFDGNQINPVALTAARISIACQNNADCDDGNACTNDVCNGSNRCDNTPNFNSITDCCNPTSGQLTPLDDGNDCTSGTCDVQTGIVAQQPLPNGTMCGNPSAGQCDLQDTCDANGTCIDRIAVAGTACGSSGTTACSNPDSCDAFGSCSSNDLPFGAMCGDPTNDQCTSADSCNGAGTCSPNHTANGTTCDDTLFCTVNESCNQGTCGNGSPTCNDNIACTDDSCNEAASSCTNALNDNLCDNLQFCDGAEVCDGILGCIVSAGSVPDCNDSVNCTIDTCDETNDQCVNTQDDSLCNNNQFCDGVEICDANLDCIVQAGTVPNCDDGVPCTIDQCNEANDACDNIPDDSVCVDDGLFCTGLEVCDPLLGCGSAGCPCGEPCTITCDETTDSCQCEAPIVVETTSRFMLLTLQPPDSQVPQAIAIRAKCNVGVMRYAGPPSPFDINRDGIPDGVLSFLVDDVADAAFLTPPQWGSAVYITGAGIAPGTFYDVAVDCGTVASPALSTFNVALTKIWGDASGNDINSAEDILQTVKFFQGDNSLSNLTQVDSDGCTPNLLVNASDILHTVLGFMRLPYDEATPCTTDCPLCHPAQCDDKNACTDDSCDINTGDCINTINFDDTMFCCNPTDRTLTAIDDGNLCTTDSCNSLSGQVLHSLIDCEDNNDCTVDSCVAGICVNTDFTDIACADNTNCPATSAGCDFVTTGRCTCPGAPAALIEWQPVSSTGPFTIIGNEIIIPSGGVEVTIDAFVSNWASEELRGLQFMILANESYSSGQTGILSPVTIPDNDAGAFIVTHRCTVNNLIDANGQVCGINGSPTSCIGEFCVADPAYIFADEINNTINLTGTNTEDYLWAMIIETNIPPAVDPGLRKYVGTLVLNVPPNAAGTFTLQFNQSADITFLLSDGNSPGLFSSISPLTLRPGMITIGN